jgi:hypothetical protein
VVSSCERACIRIPGMNMITCDDMFLWILQLCVNLMTSFSSSRRNFIFFCRPGAFDDLVLFITLKLHLHLQAWWDDVEVVEIPPLPMTTLLLEPAYRGRVTKTWPPNVRVRIALPPSPQVEPSELKFTVALHAAGSPEGPAIDTVVLSGEWCGYIFNSVRYTPNPTTATTTTTTTTTAAIITTTTHNTTTINTVNTDFASTGASSFPPNLTAVAELRIDPRTALAPGDYVLSIVASRVGTSTVLQTSTYGPETIFACPCNHFSLLFFAFFL